MMILEHKIWTDWREKRHGADSSNHNHRHEHEFQAAFAAAIRSLLTSSHGSLFHSIPFKKYTHARSASAFLVHPSLCWTFLRRWWFWPFVCLLVASSDRNIVLATKVSYPSNYFKEFRYAAPLRFLPEGQPPPFPFWEVYWLLG